MQGFKARVDYADQAIRRNDYGRALDACFELDDGAFIVAALMRRADRDAQLDAAIRRMFRQSDGYARWQTTAFSLCHISEDRLPASARLHRRRQTRTPCGQLGLFQPELS